VPETPTPPPRRFGYYDRLTRVQQRIYRQSDAVTNLRLPGAAELYPHVAALDAALVSEDRFAVQVASQILFTGLTRAFAVGPCRVEVLAARPHGRWGELQGLYTEDRRLPRVQLWMRTARQRRVVAGLTSARCSTSSAITSTIATSSSPTPSTPRGSTSASRVCSTSSCRSPAALSRTPRGRATPSGRSTRG
jgi:hypothetical protein